MRPSHSSRSIRPWTASWRVRMLLALLQKSMMLSPSWRSSWPRIRVSRILEVGSVPHEQSPDPHPGLMWGGRVAVVSLELQDELDVLVQGQSLNQLSEGPLLVGCILPESYCVLCQEGWCVACSCLGTHCPQVEGPKPLPLGPGLEPDFPGDVGAGGLPLELWADSHFHHRPWVGHWRQWSTSDSAGPTPPLQGSTRWRGSPGRNPGLAASILPPVGPQHGRPAAPGLRPAKSAPSPERRMASRVWVTLGLLPRVSSARACRACATRSSASRRRRSRRRAARARARSAWACSASAAPALARCARARAMRAPRAKAGLHLALPREPGQLLPSGFVQPLGPQPELVRRLLPRLLPPQSVLFRSELAAARARARAARAPEFSAANPPLSCPSNPDSDRDRDTDRVRGLLAARGACR